MSTEIREEVRARYAAAARQVREDAAEGRCAGAPAGACACGDPGAFGPSRYGSDLEEVPAAAVAASLGCGNPTAIAELAEGEVVLDLGSGGGIDVLLAARRVGAGGKVFGLDMTEEMLQLALSNRAEAGATNVEFLKGDIEAIPLPAGTIDVIISNCVINLSADKDKVFSEMRRVLRPGGRVSISDVVAGNHLSPAERLQRGSWVRCIAGALSFEEYEGGLTAVGFEDVSVTPTHEVADGMHAALVRARKGVSGR